MNRRFVISLIFLLAAIALLAAWNLSIGSASLSIGDILSTMLDGDPDDTAYKIIYKIRLPRILSAMILGGALSLSGFLLQTFFANPIAGPYVLGISSGAKLFVAMSMIFFMEKGLKFGSLFMVSSSFLGSIIAMGLVLIFSIRVKKMSVLIVCGILIGYICSAITDFFVTFASDSNIVNLHNWAIGSFSGANWTNVKIMSIIVFPAALAMFLLSKQIGAFEMGENYARNMGVNVKALRVILILFSSLLSACVTAFAGPISFIGIAIPHLTKSATKTSKPLMLIPASFLGGSAATLLCDGLARTLFAPTEVSISSVTAVFFVPVVIYMMLKKKR